MPLITIEQLSQRQRDRDTADALASLLSGTRYGADDALAAVKMWRLHADPRFHGLLTGEGFRWNPIKQQYVAKSGKPITAKQLKDISLAFSEAVAEDVESSPEKKKNRRGLLIGFYIAMAALAAGGFRRLIGNLIQHHRNAPSIENSLGYLGKLEQKIEQGTAGSPAQIAARMQLYWAYGNSIFEEVKRRSHEEARGYDGKKQTWLERNVLGEAERHCHTNDKTPGCIELTALGWRPLGTIPIIGTRTCKMGCKCSIEYKAIDPGDVPEPIEQLALAGAGWHDQPGQGRKYTMFSSDTMTPLERMRERMLCASADQFSHEQGNLWDESKHHRGGHPENKGEFSKGGGGSGAEKPATKEDANPSAPDSSESDYAKNGTKSKAFKAWFGDWENDPASASKVTNEEGEPETVYHWTPHKFDRFRTSGRNGLGAHFGSKEQAERRQGKVDRNGGRFIEVNLNIKNPLRLKDHGNWGFYGTGLKDELVKKGIISKKDVSDRRKWHEREYAKLEDEFKDDPQMMVGYKKKWREGVDQRYFSSKERELSDQQEDWIQKKIKDAGYDGIVYLNVYEFGKDSWIAFEPHQIKSVANRGTFDPSNNDISFSSDTPMRQPMTLLGMQQRMIQNRARMRGEPTFASDEGDVHFRQINTTPGENGKNHGGNTVAISNKTGTIVGGVPPAVASKLNSHITEHRQQRVDKIMGMRHGTPMGAVKARMQGLNQPDQAQPAQPAPVSQQVPSPSVPPPTEQPSTPVEQLAPAEPVHHPDHHEHLSARHHGAAAEYEKAAKEHTDHAANAKGIGNDELHAKHTALADDYLQKMGKHKALGEEHAEKAGQAAPEPSAPTPGNENDLDWEPETQPESPDASGGTPQPLKQQVFHGAKQKISGFDPSKFGSNRDAGLYGEGSYTTENPEVAKKYGSVVHPVDLDLKNPYHWPKGKVHDKTSNDVRSVAQGTGSLPKEIRDDVMREYNRTVGNKADNLEAGLLSEPVLAKALTSVLKQRGHDGVVYDNPYAKGKQIEHVAFDPSSSRVGSPLSDQVPAPSAPAKPPAPLDDMKARMQEPRTPEAKGYTGFDESTEKSPKQIDFQNDPAMNNEYDEKRINAMEKDARGGIFSKGKLSTHENDAIRKFSHGFDSDIREIDKGTNKVADPTRYKPGQSPQELHKAMMGAYEKLPEYDGPVYRGMAVSPAELEQLKNEKTMELPAMSSFSRKASVAHNFSRPKNKYDSNKGVSVIMKMNAKSKEMSHLSKFREREAETLLKKGTKFNINKSYWSVDPHGRRIFVIEGNQDHEAQSAKSSEPAPAAPAKAATEPKKKGFLSKVGNAVGDVVSSPGFGGLVNNVANLFK